MKIKSYIFFLVSTLFLAFVYFYNWAQVGYVLSEDLKINNYNRVEAEGVFCAKYRVRQLNQIDVHGHIDSGDLSLIENSGEMFYSKINNKIYFLDFPNEQDDGLLKSLFSKGNIKINVDSVLGIDSDSIGYIYDDEYVQFSNFKNANRDVAIKNLIENYQYNCDQKFRSNLTELYWAAKGTSIIHHWAHFFYPALLSGIGLKAQYGYFLPVVSKFISDEFGGGVTNLIRTAWILFFLIGVIVTLLYFYMFGYSLASLVMFLFKVGLFAALGSFAILLSPGYHWSRDLVVLLSGLVCVRLIKSGFAKNEVIILFLMAILGYLLDPMFAVVGLLATILLLGFVNVKFLIRNSRHLFFIAVAGGVLFLITDLSLFSYVWAKLKNGDYGLIEYNPRTLAKILLLDSLAIIILWSIKNDRAIYLYAKFFSISFLLINFYYFITPDIFHYRKVVGFSFFYIAPCLIILSEKYKSYIEGVPDYFKCIFSCTLITFSILWGGYWLVGRDPGKNLLVENWSGRESVINGNVINGSISPYLESKLNAFSLMGDYDFLITPYDKYIIFTHRLGNGFGVPDLLMTLDSEGAQDNLYAVIKTAKHADVLLDEDVLITDFDFGINRFHPVYGGLHFASKVNNKAWIRASEVVYRIKSECMLLSSDKDNRWSKYRCGIDD